MLRSAALIGIALVLMSFDIPKGWFKDGTAADSYEMGIEKGMGQNGANAATIKSIDTTINGFGTLMQSFKPDEFVGKRVRMSGYIKTKDVVQGADLWMEVDNVLSDEPASFDNMRDRTVKGTTDWTKYEIVLDVPEDADNISFGAALYGTGQMWFDRISFQIVDDSVLTTGPNQQSAPTNLSFEK